MLNHKKYSVPLLECKKAVNIESDVSDSKSSENSDEKIHEENKIVCIKKSEDQEENPQPQVPIQRTFQSGLTNPISKTKEDIEYESISQKLLQMIANFDMDGEHNSMDIMDTLDTDQSNLDRKETFAVSESDKRKDLEGKTNINLNKYMSFRNKNTENKVLKESMTIQSQPKVENTANSSERQNKRKKRIARLNLEDVNSSLKSKSKKPPISNKKIIIIHQNNSKKNQKNERRVIEIEDLDDSLEMSSTLKKINGVKNVQFNKQINRKEKHSKAFVRGIEAAEVFIRGMKSNENFIGDKIPNDTSVEVGRQSMQQEIQGLESLINSRVQKVRQGENGSTSNRFDE